MRVSLDWNCVIALENNEDAAEDVRWLVERHKPDDLEVGILVASASESTRDKRFPRSAKLFEKRLEDVGLSNLPRIPMPLVQSMTFYGYGYYADDQFEQMRDEIWNVMFPDIERSPTRFLGTKQGISSEKLWSPSMKKWRNAWCDVLSVYCHIREGRDVFVTANTDDFQRRSSRLKDLGVGDIATASVLRKRLKAL